MVNYKAKRGYTLLHSYQSAGTETSMLYTPNPVIAFGDWTKIILYMKGVTTATLELRMKLSALTSGYDFIKTENDSGTLASTHTAAAAIIALATANVIDAAKQFDLEITFSLTSAGIIIYHWHFLAAGEGNVYGSGSVSDTTIDSIEILVSTSTWTSDTDCKIYGLR